MLLCLGSINAQIHFEKGYFILNNGTKTECLIKNNEWDNSPSKIFYKLNETSEVIKLDVAEILEFSVSNSIKYGRFDVEIDETSENLNKIGIDREPIYTKKNVLLKYLVEGSANLYLYSVSNTVKYFYSINNSKPIQLVYKKFFLADKPDKIRINDSYKQQLFNNVNCQNIDFQKIEKIEFEQKPLEKHFNDYNECKGDTAQVEKKSIVKNAERKGKLRFGPTFGINQTSLTITNIDFNEQELDFKSSTGLCIGLEFEYIFSFYKNKWSLLLNPNYSKNSSTANYNFSTLSVNLNEDVKYEIKTFEIPIGIRHYMFLNDNSKIFLNFGTILSFNNVSKIQSKNNPSFVLDKFKKNQQNIFLGIGYSQNKISGEFRYNTKMDLDEYLLRESNFNKFSLIFKYNIF